MIRRSIRFRLAVWYSAVLALALVAFGIVSWIAVRHVLFHTVNETLRDRVEGVRKFMDEQIGVELTITNTAKNAPLILRQRDM